jgi:hypothetical protein
LAIRNFIPAGASFSIEKNSLIMISHSWPARSQHNPAILPAILPTILIGKMRNVSLHYE